MLWNWRCSTGGNGAEIPPTPETLEMRYLRQLSPSCLRGGRLSGITVPWFGIKGGVFILHLWQVCLFRLFCVIIRGSQDWFTSSFAQGSRLGGSEFGISG